MAYDASIPGIGGLGDTAPPPSFLRAFYTRYKSQIIGTSTVVLFFVVWQTVASLTLVNPIFISSPSRVFNAASDLIASGELWYHLEVSGIEFFWGYALAILIGIPLGIALGWYRRFNYGLSPFVNALFAAPRVAFMPLIVIWLGVGFNSKLMLIVLSAIFPILLTSRDAVKTTPANLLQAARSFEASQWQIFRTIILPAAVPFIIAGLRLGAGRALIGLFVAELYVAQAGVGFMIAQAGATFNTDVVIFGAMLFILAGMLTLGLLGRLERRFDKWRPAVGAGE